MQEVRKCTTAPTIPSFLAFSFISFGAGRHLHVAGGTITLISVPRLRNWVFQQGHRMRTMRLLILVTSLALAAGLTGGEAPAPPTPTLVLTGATIQTQTDAGDF